jgi:ribosomal protein S2
MKSNQDIIFKTLVIPNNNNSIQHMHAICQQKSDQIDQGSSSSDDKMDYSVLFAKV